MRDNDYVAGSGGVGVLVAERSVAADHGGTRTEEPGTLCLASLDAELNVVAANEEFFDQFGLSSVQVCGRSLYRLFDPATRLALEHQFVRLTDGHHPRFVERVVGLCGAAEEPFTGELTGTAVWEKGDRLSAILVTMRSDRVGTNDSDSSTVLKGRRPSRRKSGLTQLDARILEGVAAGESTVQLAGRLYLSRQGIEYHVGSLLRRLGVANRAALVSRAYSIGLLTTGHWPPKVPPDAMR